MLCYNSYYHLVSFFASEKKIKGLQRPWQICKQKHTMLCMAWHVQEKSEAHSSIYEVVLYAAICYLYDDLSSNTKI
jgi:hypothetical protein